MEGLQVEEVKEVVSNGANVSRKKVCYECVITLKHACVCRCVCVCILRHFYQSTMDES